MILDTGICTVYRKYNDAAPGHKPEYARRVLHTSWYGELNYETAPAWPTRDREEVRADKRVRILENREIANHDEVELADLYGNVRMYQVTRAYHGTDDQSGERITDLTLEAMEYDD